MSDLIIAFWLKVGSLYVDKKKFVNNSVIPWELNFAQNQRMYHKNIDFANISLMKKQMLDKGMQQQ